MRTLPQPDVAIPAMATVGEGPVIDRRTGLLCWVDIPEGVLRQDDPNGAEPCVAVALRTQLGAVAPRAHAAGFAVAVADGFLPNGIGWSPDDATMYLADSSANVVLRADFDAVDGRVGEFTPLCRVEPGMPDGLAVDGDGCAWVAVWGGAQVRRHSAGGRLLAIALPTGCAGVPVAPFEN